MAKRYEAALSLPVHELQDVHALIAMITGAEVEYRDHVRTQKYLKASKLPTTLYLRTSFAMLKEALPGNRYSGSLTVCL